MKVINVLCMAALALFLGSCSDDDKKDDVKDKTVTLDENFCNKIDVYIDDEGDVILMNNSKDGITVTLAGDEEDDGFYSGDIYLYKASTVLTFTSSVGKIKKVEVFDAYRDSSDNPDCPVDWTWNSSNCSFVWTGTPAEAVNMAGKDGSEIELYPKKIVFTLE